MMVVPSATISWTRRPCRLLRCAASLRSRVALRRRVERRPLALLPLQAPLPALLDAALRIEVLRVVGAPLPVHLALESPDRLSVGRQLGAEQLQTWTALTGDDGNGRGS